MRWERQRVGAEEPQLALPGMPGLVRTVRTPEFAGMVFHEVRARSVLNRVPGPNPMPFEWTVNPYRGCSHACTYCMVGETPILLADGRTRSLAELRVGDRVYGTVSDGSGRRYTPTTVLDHWSTTKPAYRVTLEDGTQLVTSGDHRLLGERGWAYVADVPARRFGLGGLGGLRGRRRGHRGRGPVLAVGDRLVGTGRFAAPPKESVDYRFGYLCGLIRGDGRLCPYLHPHAGPGRHARRLRLAVAEYQALARAREYLASAGIATDRFRMDDPPAVREILTIRTGDRHDVETIGQLLRWPIDPSDDWRKGFLAGVFDVEGSHGDMIGIDNTDPEVIGQVVAAARRFGFDTAVGTVDRPSGATSVLLAGGIAERLRFFHTVDPAITRKRTVDGAAIGVGALSRVSRVEPLGMELPLYDITTGTGDFVADGVVSHNCFARNSHTYLDLDAGADFDRQVVVKVNAPEVLARELRSPSWRGSSVAMGTNTDPYQRAEGRYRLMPGIIDALVGTGTSFSVLTKGTLLGRDLPLLVDAARRVDVGVAVSVAMLDRTLSASVEPGTPSPRARLDLVRRINDAGLRCGVMVAPVLPGLTDGADQLDDLLGEISAAGAPWATVLALHLRPGTRQWFRAWLAREHPDLGPRYDEIYAHGSYADRRYRGWLARRVGPLVRRHGLAPTTRGRRSGGGEPEPVAGSPPAAEQLTLL